MLLMLALMAGVPVAETASPDQPVFSATTCDDPVKRKALLETDPEKLDAINKLQEKSAANEARMRALVDRLAERAKWTSKQRSDFGVKLLNAPGLDKLMAEGFDLAGTMMKQVGLVMDSKDDVKNCHAIVDMMAIVPKIDTNAQQQWDLMRGVVEAEAKRLGISLE